MSSPDPKAVASMITLAPLSSSRAPAPVDPDTDSRQVPARQLGRYPPPTRTISDVSHALSLSSLPPKANAAY